jgi:hypothetical protein
MSYGHKGKMVKDNKYEIKKKREKNDTEVAETSVDVTTHLTYLLTYFLTPWNTVLLEKQTGFQLVKKFSAFYGSRRFITAVTSFRHLSLS